MKKDDDIIVKKIKFAPEIEKLRSSQGWHLIITKPCRDREKSSFRKPEKKGQIVSVPPIGLDHLQMLDWIEKHLSKRIK